MTVAQGIADSQVGKNFGKMVGDTEEIPLVNSGF
jgi:hypothetical protein